MYAGVWSRRGNALYVSDNNGLFWKKRSVIFSAVEQLVDSRVVELVMEAKEDAASGDLEEAEEALVDELNSKKLDMVVARRLSTDSAAYRAGHEWGNRMLTGAVARIFGHLLTDILSGYRAFSRRFVKSFPAMASGFEIETELTIHSLQLRLPVGEIDTPYFARPEGSASKLNTYRDGFRILGTIVRLFVLEKPFQFFGLLAGQGKMPGRLGVDQRCVLGEGYWGRAHIAVALRGLSDRWTHGLGPMPHHERVVAMLVSWWLVLVGFAALRILAKPSLGFYGATRRLEETSTRRLALGTTLAVALVGFAAGVLPGGLPA